MTRGKEFSEQELVALRALDSALGFAAVIPVTLTYVRRFRKVRDVVRGGLARCIVNLEFGFRSSSNTQGAATASVVLRQLLASDPEELCGHFLIWAPETATVTVRKGQALVLARSDRLNTAIGSEAFSWLVYVRHAPARMRA